MEGAPSSEVAAMKDAVVDEDSYHKCAMITHLMDYGQAIISSDAVVDLYILSAEELPQLYKQV